MFALRCLPRILNIYLPPQKNPRILALPFQGNGSLLSSVSVQLIRCCELGIQRVQELSRGEVLLSPSLLRLGSVLFGVTLPHPGSDPAVAPSEADYKPVCSCVSTL